jgi:hypothetical protein
VVGLELYPVKNRSPGVSVVWEKPDIGIISSAMRPTVKMLLDILFFAGKKGL